MIVKGIIFEDFVNYKKCSMTIIFPNCSFKCGKELCHNAALEQQENIFYEVREIVHDYLENPLSEALVLSGLEPFDSFGDMMRLITAFSKAYEISDDIVIYTGYYEHEIKDKLMMLQSFSNNIIVKFGRYEPEHSPHYDEVLGVNLAGPNQYAKYLKDIELS